MALEEEFAIEIPDSEADKIQSTADAISYIAAHPMVGGVLQPPLCCSLHACQTVADALRGADASTRPARACHSSLAGQVI